MLVADGTLDYIEISYGMMERRMLPVILILASTAHKMPLRMVDHAVVYLGSRTLVAGQAYVALSRVKSLTRSGF